MNDLTAGDIKEIVESLYDKGTNRAVILARKLERLYMVKFFAIELCNDREPLTFEFHLYDGESVEHSIIRSLAQLTSDPSFYCTMFSHEDNTGLFRSVSTGNIFAVRQV